MLLLGMNSKRQRRPNVRLGEIGDISAALSCFSSHRPKQNLEKEVEEEKRYKNELENPRQTDFNPIFGYSVPSSGFMDLDSGPSLNDLGDTLQNRENCNPNSSKSVYDFTCSDETNITKPMLDFGTVTRRGRVMKRRGRNTGLNIGLVGRAWSSRVNPETSEKNNNFDGLKCDVCFDAYTVDNGFDDSSDRDTSNTDKEAWEDYLVEPAVSDLQVRGESNEILLKDVCRKPETLDPGEGQSTDPESGCGIDKMGFPGRVGSVSEWLEGLGFSKYVSLFEIHEVDEDVLPLLTFEDLKEMGINAVGSRRKIYNAIQLLKEGVLSQ